MSEFQRPPAGTDVDQTHVVTLLPSPPLPNVSLRLGDGQVLLSRHQLEKMAEDAVPIRARWEIDPKGVTEEQRLSMILGRRARDLLEAISDHAYESGYLADETKLPGEAHHFLAHLLEEGAAAVVSLETGETIPTLKVHFKGVRAGPTAGRGFITYSFDTGTERGFLFMTNWWVS